MCLFGRPSPLGAPASSGRWRGLGAGGVVWPRSSLRKLVEAGADGGDWPMGFEGETQVVGNHVVGNIGLYFAAYRLSKMGWNVMPTARNAKGVDIIAYDASAAHYLGIQVKALSRKTAVPLGNSDKFIGDWWVIVTQVAAEPVCFIMKPAEVKGRAVYHPPKNGKRASYWLSANQYDTDEFREAWDRIGNGASTELISTIE